MTQHKTVNDTVDHIDQLCGSPLEVEGVLKASPGGVGEREYWLLHYPKAERRSAGNVRQTAQLSGLLLDFGDGSIRPNPVALARWEGKRIRVHGIVWPAKTSSSSDFYEGSVAYYPHIEVYSVQRVTSEQRREDA